jgi:hypothetical protein
MGIDMMAKTISEDCTAAAFYGVDPSPEAMERLYRRIVAWFESHGAIPDKAAIEGTGFSGKLATFKGMETRLKRAGFDQVTGFTLLSTLPNAYVYGEHYFMAAELGSNTKDFVISMRRSLVPLAKEPVLPFVRDLAQDLKARYGVGYLRPAKQSPTLYASGLVMGLELIDPEHIEGGHIGFWRDAIDMRVWEEGKLRDVYPWNFLNEVQLARPVGGIAFADWIRAAPGRGTLEPFGEMMFWEVPAADIRALRRTLWLAGNIYYWPRDIEGMEANPGAAVAHKFWE